MMEIEIKARADHDALRKTLKNLGVVAERTVEETDMYYNAPDRDFGKTDEALRIRDEGGQIFLTYKGCKIDPGSKTRKEVEVEVADRLKMADILLSLGFRETRHVHKFREIYVMQGAHICLDTVDELGEFVEFETLAADESDIEKRREFLVGLMRRLGIKDELIRESYLEMLLAKKV